MAGNASTLLSASPLKASPTAVTATTQLHPPEGFWYATFHEPISLFTFALAIATIVLGISTTLLWLTTRRLAIDTKSAGNAQADKMERSIQEAARSAAAMQRVAESTEINAAQILRSVDMQRRFGQLQLRPYLSVVIGQGIYQDERLRFEVRPRIINTGHTAARDVRWRIAADILALDEIAKFKFPLPEQEMGGCTIGPHQDAYMGLSLPERVDDKLAEEVKWGGGGHLLTTWGYISYRDHFKRRHLCTFAQHVWWRKGTDGGMLLEGVYLHEHNRTN